METYDWKQDAMQRYADHVAEANDRKLQREGEALKQTLANLFGLDATPTLAQYDQVIANIDGVTFTLGQYPASKTAVRIVRICPDCEQPRYSWDLADWIALGETLATADTAGNNGTGRWTYHPCPKANRTPEADLAAALDAVLENLGYTKTNC